MAPLKAVWLSHVIMYLVCLASIVGIGEKKKTKAPKNLLKINNERLFSFCFSSFLEVVLYTLF